MKSFKQKSQFLISMQRATIVTSLVFWFTFCSAQSLNLSKEQTLTFINQQLNDYKPTYLSGITKQEVTLEYDWLILKTYTAKPTLDNAYYYITKYKLTSLKNQFVYSPYESGFGGPWPEFYRIEFDTIEPLTGNCLRLADKVAAEKTLNALKYLKKFITKSPF